MKMKKTWFSYLMWLIYAIISGILFAAYLSAFGMNILNWNKWQITCMVCLVFAGTVGIWFAGNKAAVIIGKKISADEHLGNMWECFLVMCLFAASILYRIYLLLHSAKIVENSIYYDMAAVKSSGGVPRIIHGASYIYTLLLSFILSFTGNKVAAGVLLQIMLQAAAVLLFYLGVRMMVGRIEAVCSMAVMTFSPVFSDTIFSLTPETCYFVLYAAGLLLLGWYVKGCSRDCKGKNVYVIFTLLGIYTGMMGYLDIIGWTYVLFAGFLCIKEAIQKENTVLKICLKFILFLLAALLVMLGLIGLDSVLSGQSFGRILTCWWETYAGSVIRLHFPAGPDKQLAVGALFLLFASFAVIGFWFHKEQKQDAWVVLLIVLLLLDMMGVGQMQYQILITAVWSIFAGIGITSMGNASVGSIAAEMNSIYEENGTAWEDDVVRPAIAELVVEEITADDDMGETDSENAVRDVPSIQFIENPLPLPKKHVKREMDYGKEVENEELDFDISIDENDDFDI